MQILEGARVQLEQVVREKLATAIADGEHAEVIRFAKLFKPLRIQARVPPHHARYAQPHEADDWYASFHSITRKQICIPSEAHLIKGLHMLSCCWAHWCSTPDCAYRAGGGLARVHTVPAQAHCTEG